MALPIPPGRPPMRFIIQRESSSPMTIKITMGRIQLTRKERMGLAWVGISAVKVIPSSAWSWASSRWPSSGQTPVL